MEIWRENVRWKRKNERIGIEAKRRINKLKGMKLEGNRKKAGRTISQWEMIAWMEKSMIAIFLV